jgi:hypothetical protein
MSLTLTISTGSCQGSVVVGPVGTGCDGSSADYSGLNPSGVGGAVLGAFLAFDCDEEYWIAEVNFRSNSACAAASPCFFRKNSSGGGPSGTYSCDDCAGSGMTLVVS